MSSDLQFQLQIKSIFGIHPILRAFVVFLSLVYLCLPIFCKLKISKSYCAAKVECGQKLQATQMASS